MHLPPQAPPVVRVPYQGDYVERDGATIWVSWRNLTDEEKDRVFQRSSMVVAYSSGGC